ncbi:MAG: tetratricopeptide repeat protein [Methanomicrobiales archaeon]|nr:tetratricopeptide repeat protein [Methanomicrobiales archaeon]MDI6876216.1 tetratricopeptide repeat protein [Methanomicrobiales archaeon]
MRILWFAVLILLVAGGLYLFGFVPGVPSAPSLMAAVAPPPDDAVTNTSRGVALANMGRYQEAIEHFDRAIAADPGYVDAWRNKALALNYLGRYQDAIACYEEVTRLDPQDGDAWYSMGAIYRRLGDGPKADECFEEARRAGYPV